jgi:hypothetical protein
MQSETQRVTYRANGRRDSTGGCVEMTTSAVVKFDGGDENWEADELVEVGFST